MQPAEKPRAFISYARADGEAIARRLHQELQEHGIATWLDRFGMVGGRDWWLQITAALAEVEFLVLIATPAAMSSEVVKKEWRHARQNGVCVFPVLVPENPPDFAAMPRWMRDSHFYDLHQQHEKLLRDLASRCEALRVPFMALDLSGSFVQRDREYRKLIGHLLDRKRDNPVATTTALWGAGGFGKTMLAAALCHDEDIQTSFDDGVLWTTLGEKPDLLTALTKLYRALTAEDPGFIDVEEATVNLAEALADRDCLIVIDDAWNSAHLKPFLRGGERCARLITTRIFEVAVDVSAERVDVDEMTADESFALLTRGVHASDATAFVELTRRLGEWPLLLDLANAALRKHIARGYAPSQALTRVNGDLDDEGFTTFDRRDAAERNQAVARSLGASLNMLAGDEPVRFRELAIFPEDVEVPISAVAVLWSMDEPAARRICERFADLALLSFAPESDTLRLHDVVRGILLRGSAASEIHDRLVRNWGDPQTLPDTFAWRWYTYHLHHAGRDRDLSDLLFNPLWLRSKLLATNINQLILDTTYLPGETEPEILQSALRMSAHVLTVDKEQVLTQLYGRLLSNRSRFARISHFCGAIEAIQGVPTLLPASPSLEQAGGPLVRTMRSESNVFSVAVTRDGRRAVAALYRFQQVRTSLEVWDLETGELLHKLTGHERHVFAVDLTPDDRKIVSGSYDHTLRLWDLKTGTCEKVLRGHKGSINTLRVLKDGRRALSGSDDGTLKLWDLDTGESVTVARHRRPITSLSVTPDERFVVAVSDDHDMRLWDLRSHEPIRRFRGHERYESIEDVAVTPDGKHVVSASHDKTLRIWDMTTGKHLRTMTGHTSYVYCVCVAPDGRHVVSGSYDNTLKVWSFETCDCLHTLTGHSGTLRTVTFTRDGRYVVSGAQDETVRVWDLRRAGTNGTLEMHASHVFCVDMTPDGRHAASGADDKAVKIWDMRSGNCIRTLEGHPGKVRRISLTEDGSRVASAEQFRGELRLWDATTGRSTTLEKKVTYEAIRLTPDGTRLVAMERYGNRLRIWNADWEASVREIELCLGSLEALALTPDGLQAILGYQESSYLGGWSFRTFDLKTGRLLRALERRDNVDGLSVSSDGRYAVVTTYSEVRAPQANLEVWDLQTEEALGRLPVARYSRELAVSSDCRYAVTATQQALQLWDLQKTQCIATFTPEDAIQSCAISSDGRAIIVGEESGRVHLLRLIGVD